MPLYSFASILLQCTFIFSCIAALYALCKVWTLRPQSGTVRSGTNRAFLHAGSGLLPIVLSVLLTVACGILLYAFITHAFVVEYVAQYSDRTLPLFYRITAFWAGQDGSLLFWAWSVAIGGAAFAFTPTYSRMTKATQTYFALFFFCIMAFFLLLLSKWSNPFTLLDFVPENGRGLNPLLQNPGMIFHPPLLFLGYGGFVVPGCLALAQTLSGHLYDPENGNRMEEPWSEAGRPFILVAWSLLTAGIILGAWWAYMELGWGGYWAWDPVENASLIPWLVASAYLHTGVISSRRGKLHRTNVFLMSLTTISAFFATYLVRSGVVQSLHAFGSGSVATPLLVFIFSYLFITLAVVLCDPSRKSKDNSATVNWLSCIPVALCAVLAVLAFIDVPLPAWTYFALGALLLGTILINYTSFPDDRPLEDLSSKEGLLLIVAWLLLAISFVILLATMWPVIIDTAISMATHMPGFISSRLPSKPMGLEPAFYNRTCLPLFTILSVLLVFCPFRMWKLREFSGGKRLLPYIACAAVCTLPAAYFIWTIFTPDNIALTVVSGIVLALIFTIAAYLWLCPTEKTRETGITQPRIFAAILLVTLVFFTGLALAGITNPVALVAACTSLAAMTGIATLFAFTPSMRAIRSTLAAHGVHIGLLMTVLGVAFSGPYQQEYTLEIGRKQTVAVGNYRVVLNELYEGNSKVSSNGEANYHFLEAELLVMDRDGKPVGRLSPQRRVYANFENQSYAEVDTIFSLGNEIYATLISVTGANRATLAFNVNPLVNWLWIGGTLMCLFPFLGLARIRREKETAV